MLLCRGVRMPCGRRGVRFFCCFDFILYFCRRFRFPREGAKRESGENPERSRRCKGLASVFTAEIRALREGDRCAMPEPEDLPFHWDDIRKLLPFSLGESDPINPECLLLRETKGQSFRAYVLDCSRLPSGIREIFFERGFQNENKKSPCNAIGTGNAVRPCRLR